ncbi:hypothetical protein FRC00_006803 [Tulasnella sp. 408]|nr:hypothetical protein FRC00_006803 [Tulasnella sp. 408]
MLFLDPSSIVHLMVDRKLRSACEQFLYRDIYVAGHPNRAIRLLKTFVLRPDLALLVQRLSIGLEWCLPGAENRYHIPHLLQPDGIAALSFAKNIRFLGLLRVDWLSNPSFAHICEMVSQMELSSLAVDEHYSTDPNMEVMMSNLRSALLSQPKLEDLSLAFHSDKAALLDKIEVQVPDVPGLNRYRGDVRFAKAFLNAATKLSLLDLYFHYEDPLHILLRENWNGNGIKALFIRTRFADVRDWVVFGGFLACFPNIESLTLLSVDWYYGGLDPLYFEDVAPQLHVLPRLRKLEVRNVFSKHMAHPGPTPEAVLIFKKHSPTLERFVDTNERQWVYMPCDGDGGNFVPRVECQLVERQRFTGTDLPAPK